MNYNNQFTEEELKHEVWKDVGECKGYEEFAGLYEVSNLGRFRSKDRVITYINGKKVHYKGKLIKLCPDKDGYLIIVIHNKGLKKNVRINRLVALAFIPNPNNYIQVNHKDETKDNNRVDNLEWCTAKYNTNYGTRSGRSGITRGKRVNQYDKQGNLLHTYDSINDALRDLNKKGGSSISAVTSGSMQMKVNTFLIIFLFIIILLVLKLNMLYNII